MSREGKGRCFVTVAGNLCISRGLEIAEEEVMFVCLFREVVFIRIHAGEQSR